MSKEQKNYRDYTLAGDETITMSAEEFVALQKGVEQGIQNGVTAYHPQVLRWYNIKTGEAVENPSQKDIASEKVKQFADPQAVSSPENRVISYKANIFPYVFDANQVIMAIFQRHVDEGIIPTIEEAKKKFEERKAKGQMKVEDDEPTMNVVSDEDKQ